jgi:hypothetical protein
MHRWLRGLSPKIAVALAIVLITASARALELGVELGLAATQASHVPSSINQQLGSGAPSPDDGPQLATGVIGGLVVEQSLRFDPFRLDLWGDLEFPVRVPDSSVQNVPFLAIDLGVRGGLALGPFEPYVGVLGQTGFLVGPLGDAVYYPYLHPVLAGLGADLGLDMAVWVMRVGVELRFVGVVSAIQETRPSEEQADELSALLSVRFVIFQ